MRGKTYGSCSTRVGSYATAAMRGKTCSCRKTRARNCATALIGGKTNTKSYVTSAMRGKTCNDFNTNAGIYAMELLPCAAKPVAVAISQGCNARLQYKRGKLCSCCYARENLRSLQYKRGKLCNCCHKGKTSGGCKTSPGKPVAVKNKRGNLCRRTAAMRSKTCGRCNLRSQYKCGKFWNCCHKRENLWRLHYKRKKLCNCRHARVNLWRQQFYKRGNYATAALRRKTYGGFNTSVVNYACCSGNYSTVAMRGKSCGYCNTSAGNNATGAMRGKNCGGFKRGNTRKLPMQTCSLFHEWEACSCLEMLAQNCLDLGGCVMDIIYQFFNKLKLNL